jgi:hypothetical protein
MPMYLLNLPEPEKARGPDGDLSFTASSPDGFAGELAEALRSDGLFQRWKAKQPDPDSVPESLGATDPGASVTGKQQHMSILLEAKTALPGDVLRQRMRLLAGGNWTLNDVR